MIKEPILINGKKTAMEVRKNLKLEVAKLPDNIVKPQLVIILIGDDFASQIYIKSKISSCKKIGFISRVINFPKTSTYDEIKECIEKLNNDPSVHGILIQVPLPKKFSAQEEELLQLVDPKKDVDCFNFANFGQALKNINPIVFPCTPKGIITLLNKYKIAIKGQNVTVIGWSNIVGKPIAIMLENMGATVTVCNIHTKNLKFHTINADIIVSATGVKDIITEEMIKEGVSIIDVGIIRNEDNSMRGDIDYKKIMHKCHAITPVPGGVGPMTVATLMQNLWCLYKKNKKS